MMATKAFHRLGDISRKEGICLIHSETEEFFVGNWVAGLGFIHVKFPKETTRALTPEEAKHYNSLYVKLGDIPLFKLNVS